MSGSDMDRWWWDAEVMRAEVLGIWSVLEIWSVLGPSEETNGKLGSDFSMACRLVSWASVLLPGGYAECNGEFRTGILLRERWFRWVEEQFRGTDKNLENGRLECLIELLFKALKLWGYFDKQMSLLVHLWGWRSFTSSDDAAKMNFGCLTSAWKLMIGRLISCEEIAGKTLEWKNILLLKLEVATGSVDESGCFRKEWMVSSRSGMVVVLPNDTRSCSSWRLESIWIKHLRDRIKSLQKHDKTRFNFIYLVVLACGWQEKFFRLETFAAVFVFRRKYNPIKNITKYNISPKRIKYVKVLAFRRSHKFSKSPEVSVYLHCNCHPLRHPHISSNGGKQTHVATKMISNLRWRYKHQHKYKHKYKHTCKQNAKEIVDWLKYIILKKLQNEFLRRSHVHSLEFYPKVFFGTLFSMATYDSNNNIRRWYRFRRCLYRINFNS